MIGGAMQKEKGNTQGPSVRPLGHNSTIRQFARGELCMQLMRGQYADAMCNVRMTDYPLSAEDLLEAAKDASSAYAALGNRDVAKDICREAVKMLEFVKGSAKECDDAELAQAEMNRYCLSYDGIAVLGDADPKHGIGRYNEIVKSNSKGEFCMQLVRSNYDTARGIALSFLSGTEIFDASRDAEKAYLDMGDENTASKIRHNGNEIGHSVWEERVSAATPGGKKDEVSQLRRMYEM